MNSARLVTGIFNKGPRGALLLCTMLLLAGCSQERQQVQQQGQQEQPVQQQPEQSTPPQSQANDAADRLAILDVQNRYIIAMDYFDADGYAAVFTEDGVLDWARGEVVGREAIREFMATGTYDLRNLNFQAAQTPDGNEWPPAVRHLVTNQVIDIDGDSARVISYWMNYSNAADRRQIQWLSYGSWDDEMVKVDGQWYFKRHKIYNENNPNRFTAGQPNPLAQ